jgi:hypothetical protein
MFDIFSYLLKIIITKAFYTQIDRSESDKYRHTDFN